MSRNYIYRKTAFLTSQIYSKSFHLFVTCNKFENIARLIAVRVNGEPYAEDPEVICKIAKKFDREIKGFDDLIDALNHISKIANQQAVRVVICGSLHLARDVKKYSKLIF